MIDDTGDPGHSILCLRLMQLFPRVARGMRRHQDRAAPGLPAPLGPRHIAALQHLRGGPLTVGTLAAALGLTLPTVSGVLADLDRAGLIGRHPDTADRRRTIVASSARLLQIASRTRASSPGERSTPNRYCGPCTPPHEAGEPA